MRTASVTSQLVGKRIRESIIVKETILEGDCLIDQIQKVANACIQAIELGGKLIFFGNGGSAADAQHLAAELTGRYLKERRALAAIALTTNACSLTAIGNDYSFDEVFSRQVEAVGNRRDIAIGISTSGNSMNVVQALKVAREKALTTVGMTGSSGGLVGKEVDFWLSIPSEDIPRIQEAHILVGHILCEIIEGSFVDERNIP